MPFKFPYTNFQELNLDWIIKKVKDLSKQIEDDSSIVSEYIDRLIAVEDKADNAEATATAADARATGANNTANSALTLATQAKQTAEIADLSTTLLGLKIGDLSSLYTTAKDTIVNAINEVWSIFHNATAVTNVTPAGTDPAVTYSNGVFTFDLPEGGDPDAVTHAELDAAIDDVEDTIDALTDRVDGLEDDIDDLSEALDDKADVIIDTASGDIASFPDGTATPLKALIVNVEPVQAGTGDPSPSNIRPISGRSGCDVTRTGKNLANMFNDGKVPSLVNGALVNFAGWRTDFIKFSPNAQFSFHIANTDIADIYVMFYDSGKNYLSATSSNVGQISTTSPINTAFVMLRKDGSAEPIEAQLEYGTATVYEPYNGNSSLITFGETVYGAKADIISGEMLVTKKIRGNLEDVNWNYLEPTSSYPYGLFYANFSEKKYGETNFIMSNYKLSTNYFRQDVSCYGNNSANVIYIMDSSFNGDVTAFKQSLIGQTICYELANPVETTITPVPVNALKGYNAVWSDAGAVEVTYRADTKGYIDKLIAQVQALALGG